MKHQWLLLGIVFLFCAWTENVVLVFLAFCISAIYHKQHYHKTMLFMVILLLYLLRLYVPVGDTLPTSDVWQVKEIKSSYVIAVSGRSKVVIYQAGDVNFNDVIEVEGKITKIDGVHNFDMFYFPKWLERRHIYYQISAKSIQLKKEGSGIRHALYEHTQSLEDSETRSWVKAMLYGIHEEDVSFFVTSSGMHISFLFHLLENILLLFLSQTSCRLLSIIGMGVLGYASVMSTSLMRLLCFRGVSYTATQASSQDKLGLSMCLTLLLFPYMAFELAFLLPVCFRFAQMFNIQKRRKQVLNMAVLIPIQLLFFHVCNPVQIFLFRFLRVFYVLLYLLALLSLLFHTASLYIVFQQVIPWLQQIETLGISIYYTPSLLWILWWLQSITNLLSYHRKKDVGFLCMLLCYSVFAPYLNPFGEVLMLDVGQGDCTLVTMPFGQGVMLIDVMGSKFKDIPADIIVPVLQSKGIHSIDKVILTHEDMDHSGGIEQLKKLIPVKEIITKKQESTKLHDLRIPFLLASYQGEDTNENSILTYLEVYGLRILFMGDAGIETEAILLQQYPDLKVDVLKAGHHGSKTASSPAFLHALDANLALISCGRNNRYGHPHTEVLANMENEHMKPLITAQKGAVSIKFSKYFSFYRTADHEFGIIKSR